MKKHLLAALLIMTSFFLQAQDELVIKGTKKIKKKFTPQQVIDSLNKRFPDAKAVQYYKVPADAAQNGWSVAEEDNLQSGDVIDYYTIRFKRDDMEYYGLYNKDGDLLQSKVQQKVDELPEGISNSLKQLGELHPGYTVTSKTYYKNENHSKNKEYYEITAQNGKAKKRLYYDAAGTLVKVK